MQALPSTVQAPQGSPVLHGLLGIETVQAPAERAGAQPVGDAVRPYYDHGGIRIYLGDCREILPTLVLGSAPEKFDLLLTDPPYGMGWASDNATRFTPATGERARMRTNRDRVAGDDEPFDPAHLLSLGVPLILWGANHFAQRLPVGTTLVWIKRNDAAFGTFLSDAEIGWKSGGHGVYCRRDISERGGANVAGRPSPWRLHPTQKPVALMSWCLSFFPEAKTVIDPYMGSGPVAKACKDRGLKYVGIELVEKYCEIAAKRLAQEVLFA